MLFSNKQSSNWDIVKNKKPKDTIKNRDVYANQQLKRGKMPQPKTKTSRVILVLLFALACGFAGYLVVGAFDYLGASLASFGNGQNVSMGYYLLAPTKIKLLGFIVAGGISFGFVYPIAMRNLQAQNATSDYTDINQYQNDQHVALPEEVMRKFQPFPDAGAHSWIQPSSMISHVALSNKGINPVQLTRRFPDDMLQFPDGTIMAKKDAEKANKDVTIADVVAYKGEPEYDEDGNRIKDTYPMFDKHFMEALFDASDDPQDPQIRKYYDSTKIPYNPGGKIRGRLGEGDANAPKSWADFINTDWTIPDYETQRPAGAYIVDTDPVNTMVLAITRAGKGQTVINPQLDMWSREQRPNNMVINDPKGELLQSFYVPFTYRGFRVVQFNLINVINTDIYNPLILAANAASEGDYTKCSTYVQNIADVFFPTEGQSDPFWPTAANNAFKRVAFGIIDYYLEEAKAYRLRAQAKGVDQSVIDTHLDRLWGKVTLYNCYQLFVRLSSKKIKNPVTELKAKDKSGALDKEATDALADEGITPDDPNFDVEKRDWINDKSEKAEKKAEFWNDQPEIDELSLYFNATDVLPRNSMRDLVANSNNSLKAMGGSDKTISSVYGIAITSMAFFTDPTISTLTSGTPSQNVDLAGASFPRRIGFRMASKFFKDWRLIGQQAVWQAYSDPEFKRSLGPDFHHEGQIDRTRWARFYFKGIFKTDTAFLKCTIRDMQTQMEITEFYFEFDKGYQTSLSGLTYTKDPVLGEKIVKGGTLYELRKVKDSKTGKFKYVRGHMTYKETQLVDISDAVHTDTVQLPVITQTSVNYAEKPMTIFMVTPPHLMAYAKIILILIKQLVDVSFDQSYMTKANQKPLYKTRFMLDELGNLQSNGKGINGFQTMLSIGLGQEQQFTLILQTLQQLKDVYGDSVDKIIQGNTSNIVFLKSTDDSLLETLEKMSGKTHVSRTNSKTVTKDLEKLVMQNEGKISLTTSTSEEPVISYNDMAFISERNSIVFRAGDSPIWNRNETILPMAWRLHMHNIKQPGHKYTFSTLPTLSTAKDFDVRNNQPNFDEMLQKRLAQAMVAKSVEESYQEAYGYTDDQIQRLDPDDYADEVMQMINVSVNGYQNASDDPNSPDNPENLQYLMGQEDDYEQGDPDDDLGPDHDSDIMKDVKETTDKAEVNKEQIEATKKAAKEIADMQEAKFAGNTIRPIDLVDKGGAINHGLDQVLIRTYRNNLGDFRSDSEHFKVGSDGSLYSADGNQIYIHAGKKSSLNKEIDELSKAKSDEEKRVFENNKDAIRDLPRDYTIDDNFYRYLAKRDTWKDLANGQIERETVRDNRSVIA